MYENPPAAIALSEGTKIPKEALEECIRHFEDFFEEVFLEMCKYGEVEDMNVCDNIGDHLIGNVYVKYYREDDTKKAFDALNGRLYAGKTIRCEYSPVTDFREAKCRQYDDGTCTRNSLM
jgi:splicing factor U2AF subunit